MDTVSFWDKIVAPESSTMNSAMFIAACLLIDIEIKIVMMAGLLWNFYTNHVMVCCHLLQCFVKPLTITVVGKSRLCIHYVILQNYPFA